MTGNATSNSPSPGEQTRWVCSKDFPLDLLSLSWGRYGQTDRVRAPQGWIYAFVSKGTRLLQLAKGPVRLPPGQLVIVDPGCACGWGDASSGASELLVWIWASAPRCPECTPPPRGFRLFPADRGLQRKLKQIHLLCRGEVEYPDSLTKLEVEQARLRLDLVIARSQRSRYRPPQTDLRLQFALRWLAQNLDDPKPVAALCDYLQISQVTLNRLFRHHFHESVATYFHRLKMERARQWLQNGEVAVKEVSLALGYKHPNDFSRAFKTFTGHSPRERRNLERQVTPRRSEERGLKRRP